MSNNPSTLAITHDSWQPGRSLVTKLLIVVAAACMLIFAGLAVFSFTMYTREKDTRVDALSRRTASLAVSLKQVDEASRYVSERVRERPITATLAGLGVGVLLGLLLAGNRSGRDK